MGKKTTASEHKYHGYKASRDKAHTAHQNTGTMGGIICCEFGMEMPLEDEEECSQGDAAAQCQSGSVTGPNSDVSAARCQIEASPPPPPPRQLLMPARAPALPLMMQPSPPSPRPSPPAPVTSKPQTGGYHQHPLGSMFYPELDEAGVLEVVSEVLCAPGFVSGPSEGKRLMASVGSGRVDIQTMSRLLRWLRGERAGRELRSRGLKFVGPETDDMVRPITTGLGMSRLIKEVIACGYPAGTQFVVGFSSNSDTCSGIISGVLTAAAQEPRPESMSDSKSSSSVSESAPTSVGGGRGGLGGRRSKKGSAASTPSPHPGRGAAWTTSSTSSSSPPSFSSPLSHPCSRSLSGFTGKEGAAGPSAPATAPASTKASSSGSSSTTSGNGVTTTTNSGSGGGGSDGGPVQCPSRRTPLPSRRKRTPSRNGGGGSGGISSSKTNSSSSSKVRDYSRTDVVAHLFDEVPTHCRGGSGNGGGCGGGCVDASGGEGLTKMEVGEWAKIYGECEGPLLAAWVFRGGDASR